MTRTQQHTQQHEDPTLETTEHDPADAAADQAAAQRASSFAAHEQFGVQCKDGAEAEAGTIRRAADAGVAASGTALPHADRIQQAFGAHDVSGVEAHVGGEAEEACDAIGAEAYATGDQVAFKAAPDLHTAAHEAAHTVQQRAGVQLLGGVGRAGDVYEQNADAVADRVVQGQSAEGLLDQMVGSSIASAEGSGVQGLGGRLDAPLEEGQAAPAEGEIKGKQRKYSVDQYIAMWEKERGRKMTAAEKDTLARGCIGITALNLEAVNPPLDHAYATFEQAMAVVKEWNAFIKAHANEETTEGVKIGTYKAVLFAKLFWSNQDPDREKRKQPAPDAYQPDPDTGKVDMSDYEYRDQPGHVNFDYGFWDEESNCFWHANHSQPGMIVYQSTREKFAKGYIDFDRIVYCAAIARDYSAMNAAGAH
jgi:hypothetical protein